MFDNVEDNGSEKKIEDASVFQFKWSKFKNEYSINFGVT